MIRTRSPYSVLFALVPAVAVLHVAHVRAAEPSKPNVLYILADDLGYGDVGCYNPASRILTPNLDLRCKLVTFTPDEDGFEKATAFVRDELDAGRPLVIDFTYAGAKYPGGEAGHALTLVGYAAKDDLYVMCNPASATHGLQLMSARDLKHYRRSDHYGGISKDVLCRLANVLDRRTTRSSAP